MHNVDLDFQSLLLSQEVLSFDVVSLTKLLQKHQQQLNSLFKNLEQFGVAFDLVLSLVMIQEVFDLF